MVCQGCGTPVTAGVRFCSVCGAAVPVSPPGTAPYAGAPLGGPGYAYSPLMRGARLARHTQIAGVLWLLFGTFRLVGGLASMFFLSAWSRHRLPFGVPFPTGNSGFPPEWLAVLIPVVEGITVISAALAFAAGFGLLTRRSWGRMVAVIAGVLALFNFPFGTALGVYTLVIFASGVAGTEYERLATDAGN